MDGWQKLEVVSKVATSNKQRGSETKCVERATAVLSKDPALNQTPENKSLRK